MFYPEGYVPFSDLMDYAESASTEIFAANSFKEYREENVANDLARYRFLEREVLFAWLLCHGLTNYRPIACSPSGIRVGISHPLTHHEDNLYWYRYSWPALDDDELGGIMRRVEEGKPSTHPLNRFRFIDFATGTICVERRMHLIRIFAHEAEENIDSQVATATNFDGWAVCFHASDFPNTIERFLEDAGLEEPRIAFASENPQIERSRGGRPSKRFVARQIYWQIYPNGHADENWKTVARKVSDAAGIGVAPRTIQRAIQEE